MKLEDLRVPFDAEDIEWRIQTAGEKGGKRWALVVPYVTNRAIQERLDNVCAPENWRNIYQPGPDGGVLCGIAIKCGDEWVAKWDGAENTQIEPVKGGLSDAMKRAAVQWGIGRHLYKLDAAFAKVHDNGKHRSKVKIDKIDVWIRWDEPTLDAKPPKSESVEKPEPEKCPTEAENVRVPMNEDQKNDMRRMLKEHKKLLPAEAVKSLDAALEKGCYYDYAERAIGKCIDILGNEGVEFFRGREGDIQSDDIVVGYRAGDSAVPF